jgi:hypothetical protein
MTKKKTNLKDHTVPAFIIGSFSDSKDGSPRKRKVYYLRREGMTSPHPQRAETIGYVKGEYDSSFGRAVDDLWDEYEGSLPELSEIFTQKKPLSINLWEKVLIPYVADLWVRSPGFRQNYENQFEALLPLSQEDEGKFKQSTKDLVAMLRTKIRLECRRVFSLYSIDVLYTSKSNFILPDLGMAYLRASEDMFRKDYSWEKATEWYGEYYKSGKRCEINPPSYLVPLSNNIAVKMTPRQIIPTAIYKDTPSGRQGYIPVRYIDCDSCARGWDGSSVIEDINKLLVGSALDWVVASDKDSLQNIRNVPLENKDFIHNEALWFLGFSKDISGNEGLMSEIIEHVKKDRKATNSREIIIIEKSTDKGHIDYVSSNNRNYLHISYFSTPRFNTKNNFFIEDYNPETKRVRSPYEFNNCYSWVP